MDLVDLQARAVEPADGDASALTTEVDCGDDGHQALSRSSRTGRRRSRGLAGTAPPGPGSTIRMSTPWPRHRRTSSPGALESVITIASRSVGTNESRALRCHLVPSM